MEGLEPISSFSPIIGIELGISVPRWFQPISLQFDLSLSRISGKSHTTIDLGHEQLLRKQYDYTTWVVPAKMGVRYTCWNTTLHPFVEAGLSTTFRMADSAKLTRTVEDGQSNADPSPDKPTGVFLGGYAGAGVLLPLKNKHYLSIRTSFETNTLFDKSYVNSKRGSLTVSTLKVGYLF